MILALLRPFLPYLIGAVVAFGVGFGLYSAGWNAHARKTDVATLQQQIADLEKSQENAEKARVDAEQKAVELARVGSQNMELVDELQKDIASRPTAEQCGLSDADVDRLRGIKDDGGDGVASPSGVRATGAGRGTQGK